MFKYAFRRHEGEINSAGDTAGQEHLLLRLRDPPLVSHFLSGLEGEQGSKGRSGTV